MEDEVGKVIKWKGKKEKEGRNGGSKEMNRNGVERNVSVQVGRRIAILHRMVHTALAYTSHGSACTPCCAAYALCDVAATRGGAARMADEPCA